MRTRRRRRSPQQRRTFLSSVPLLFYLRILPLYTDGELASLPLSPPLFLRPHPWSRVSADSPPPLFSPLFPLRLRREGGREKGFGRLERFLFTVGAFNGQKILSSSSSPSPTVRWKEEHCDLREWVTHTGLATADKPIAVLL